MRAGGFMDERNTENQENFWRILLIFLRLGFTSFGGPIAHLGYFREAFVVRRQWLTEQAYADLIAFCQFLPGPASSQVGLSLGFMRGGYSGGLAAWLGFTLPSAAALVLFALGLTSFGDATPDGVLHGLKVAAVAVVARAVWGMSQKLCPDTSRRTLMVAACCLVIAIPGVAGQIGVILLAALTGMLLLKTPETKAHDPLPMRVKPRTGAFYLALFIMGLIGLPLLVQAFPSQALALADTFYRTGSLVFGGGHVVLPLLQAEVTPPGWISTETFLAGYGAAQAVPGPLFTFSAFLGASMNTAPHGWAGAAICLSAIYLPSFLLVAGALPFWERLRHNELVKKALTGVNAAVAGLLLAALYDPVWTSAILGPQDFCLALFGFAALQYWKCPPWLMVFGCGAAGALLAGLT